MYVVDLLSLSLSISLHDLLLEMQGGITQALSVFAQLFGMLLEAVAASSKGQAGRQANTSDPSIRRLSSPPPHLLSPSPLPATPTPHLGFWLLPGLLVPTRPSSSPLPSDYYQWRPLLAARSVTHSLGHCHCHAYASKPQLVDLIDLVFLFLISFM